MAQGSSREMMSQVTMRRLSPQWNERESMCVSGRCYASWVEVPVRLAVLDALVRMAVSKQIVFFGVFRMPSYKLQNQAGLRREKQQFKSAAFTLAVLIGIGSAAPVWACSDLPNICDQQQAVFEQNQEMAREAAQDYADQRDEERDGGQPSGPPPRDPMDVRMDAMAAGVIAMHSAFASEIERMKKDPVAGPIIRGKWDFFQDTNNPKPGEYCAALYTNIAGFLRLSGPGGSYRGALLTFWGPDIPKPKKVRWVSVTLKQLVNNDPNNTSTQTVGAYNYTEKQAKGLGVIALAVPSVDALLNNISDHLDFRLEVGGKEVQVMGFHSGLKAREKLRRCIAKRG
ncbi:MAG: hypothetical protein J0H31_06150 [Alphaproteobacteria bacterium]|nr:hypothetical protein [Alphaproteobacteria bacterium]